MRKQLLTLVLAVLLSIVTVSVASAQGGETVHYVTFGESLSGIAYKYGVSTQALMQYNRLTNADLVYVGQPLTIPGNSGNYTAQACADYHVVTAGETLSGIAFDYGLTLQELLLQNNLYNSNFVYVGQRVCLPSTPGYKPQPASYQQNYRTPANGHYHTVTSGETLAIIASRYGINYRDIMRANNMYNAGFIMAGQQLLIPGYQPAPASPPIVQHYNQPEKPAYKRDEAPRYAPPPPPEARVAPPPAPVYYASDDDPSNSVGAIPEAPEYQPSPALPILPIADHPIEIVINGGINWVGKADPAIPDPNSITTLIVRTGNEFGQTVRVRSGDYEVAGESDMIFTGEFGPHSFVFRYIPPGDYDVWIDDPDRPSEVVHVKVEPGNRVSVFFDEGVIASGPTFASPGGWILSSWDNPSKPAQNIGGWSNILVHTPASGLWVRIESEGGGYQAKCFTGSKGPGSCDFAGLRSGLYWIWIDGTDLTVKTYMDGAAYATFTFDQQPVVSSENVIGPVSYDEGS